MDICSDCGERSVTEEEENGHLVRVCQECGAVSEHGGHFTSEREFIVSI